VLWLATLGARPLFNTDEGRYAEIPRELLAGGDWVIPHLNGVAYIEKPPLQYWATALALRWFGDGEFAARLYTGLCALGTLVVVWLLADGVWGGEAAWRSAAVLAGMMLFVTMGQLLTLDMSLTFCMTLALAAFLLAQPRGAARSHAPTESRVGGAEPSVGRAAFVTGRRSMLLAWLAVALGVLTKGLVAAAIPAAVLVLYSVLARDFAPWRRLELARGLPLFLVVTVPWHWLAARRLADFVEFFFVHEHLARYLTPSADREAPCGSSARCSSWARCRGRCRRCGCCSSPGGARSRRASSMRECSCGYGWCSSACSSRCPIRNSSRICCRRYRRWRC